MALATQLEAEREALDALVRSDGWALLLGRVQQQWGDPAVVQALRTALAQVDRGDLGAQRETSAQVLAAQKQIFDIFRWPAQRVKELEGLKLQTETRKRTPARRAFHRHGVGTDVTREP